MIIKDKIARGAIAGMVAAIPQLLVNVLSVKIGFAEHYAFQYAASVFIYQDLTYSLSGIIFGLLVWESMAAGLGVLTGYLIYFTGRDYWWLKGLLISNTLMFIFLYGFYFGLEAPKIVSWDLPSNWTIFIENIVFGIVTGYFVLIWSEKEPRSAIKPA